ncbi:hypothetical protein WJX84_005337 [Apatococcus fuscideae]|uniref:Aminotransferase class I/classII large domain-containing protein n=1 Tax=Apatococcus fuscideae TaxID=2026836 RepID=A0AAW1RKS2_9CHLO
MPLVLRTRTASLPTRKEDQRPSRRLLPRFQGGKLARASMAHSGFAVEVNPAVAGLKPSKTMVLSDLARDLQESGVDIISLAAGEPDFDTPEVIVEAGIEALRQGITHYTANTGTAALRAAICAKFERENGLQYAPNEVVVSNGAKQSVWQGLLGTCSPGDEVLIPAPYWTSYPEMASLAGAKPVILDCPKDQDYMLTPQQLEAALTPSSRPAVFA